MAALRVRPAIFHLLMPWLAIWKPFFPPAASACLLSQPQVATQRQASRLRRCTPASCTRRPAASGGGPAAIRRSSTLLEFDLPCLLSSMGWLLPYVLVLWRGCGCLCCFTSFAMSWEAAGSPGCVLHLLLRLAWRVERERVRGYTGVRELVALGRRSREQQGEYNWTKMAPSQRQAYGHKTSMRLCRGARIGWQKMCGNKRKCRFGWNFSNFIRKREEARHLLFWGPSIDTRNKSMAAGEWGRAQGS